MEFEFEDMGKPDESPSEELISALIGEVAEGLELVKALHHAYARIKMLTDIIPKEHEDAIFVELVDLVMQRHQAKADEALNGRR